ncbi:hypothetical protein Cob_v009912 [Colletotrichum orbiculare MAFF 240422]|uniref:Uncharacterized protein n=1 Tax=Colletotrichum orbiculare (strain 104-T / ATCC 96160 / CBS 514.97 / LARS 414 / MAFF 240422) TaxID=1213857 RepID=A0A484FHR9_COLOR|nr:hypothetical protein Cob_v009912 [Colletotrichum orbiculare MAFF 240422]
MFQSTFLVLLLGLMGAAPALSADCRPGGQFTIPCFEQSGGYSCDTRNPPNPCAAGQTLGSIQQISFDCFKEVKKGVNKNTCEYSYNCCHR